MVTTAAQNRELTETSAGTPMGELLRRYWHPIAAEGEFLGEAAEVTKAVRLLGEDLVLYRSPDGSFGLIEPHCPHRRAGLLFGYPEVGGIRCSYHGWKFGFDGSCVEAPFEDRSSASADRFRQAICARAYRAEARFGLVWAYLGPDPAPLIPTWEPFTFENCFRQILFHRVDCNWLQCQENSIDPVHFEWLHNNWLPGRAGAPDRYAPAHTRLGFDEWEHGFMYRRLHVGEDETSDAWNTGRLCIMPNLFAPTHFEWRVPIDDENTLSVVWVFERVPDELGPYRQGVIPHWWGRTHDDDGRPITSHVLNQDLLSWAGQGRIADRTKENLGRSDHGVLLFRKRLLADLAAVQRGEDPSCVFRDEEANRCIRFPNDLVRRALNVPTVDAVRARLAAVAKAVPSLRGDTFFLMAGQPAAVRAEWAAAMGLDR
ncbi:MAG: aromatic ring-hydroxylating dioxygenase subunit alpha [Acidimicrobiia bacterium]|nr:aromatic ring-hydroxylating dioxygenase subunit alpha [Acidimicrobiia bacterium]